MWRAHSLVSLLDHAMRVPTLVMTLLVGIALILTACRDHSTLQIGTPSFAGVSEPFRPEAIAAFQHAKRFISTASVDTAKVDLLQPMIFHRPGSPPPLDHGYDWAVQFKWKTPRSNAPYGIVIAVKNDGTC